MVCASCGNNIREGANFCDSCGVQVAIDDDFNNKTFEVCSPEEAIKKIVSEYSVNIYNDCQKLKWLLSGYLSGEENMARLLSIALDNDAAKRLHSVAYLNNNNFELEFTEILTDVSKHTFIPKEIVEKALAILCIGLNKKYKSSEHREDNVEEKEETSQPSITNFPNRQIVKEKDIDKKVDVYGNTALIIAADDGNVGEVVSLVNRGADVNAKNKYGNTVLICAAEKGHIDVIKLLIAFGANLNAEGNKGCTALMEAASRCRIEVVKLLISFGANVNARQDNGKTALSIAFSHGHTEVIKLLKASGARS